MKHTKGPMAGKPFELLPWQSQIVRDLFGWKRADGTRKYRIAYIEVPRKNGKSAFAAGLALMLLLTDLTKASGMGLPESCWARHGSTDWHPGT